MNMWLKIVLSACLTSSMTAAEATISVALRAAPIDPDAAAYAELTGLSGAPLNRLSGFLHDLKDAGIDLKLVTLGRSEFLARSGSTHRAVIGPDATITNFVGNDGDGMRFNGKPENVFEFDNPAPFTDGNVWQMVVVIPDAVARYTLISGASNGTPEHGPEVRYRENGRVEYRAGVPPDGARITRQNSMATGGAGVPMLYGGQVRDSNNIDAIKDIYPQNVGGIGNGRIWNDQPVWRLGSNLSNGNRLEGIISVALAGEGVLGREQVYRMAAAIVRHGVGSITPPRWIGFIGDSMTVSTAGGASGDRSRSSLWTTEPSGWRGSFWDMCARGGRPWAGTSPNQEEFFNETMTRMSWVPDMPRTIVFWAGYNTPHQTWGDPALWMALADHYINAAAKAAAAGIQTVHWSRVVGANGSSPGSLYWDAIYAFNDYYRDQLALLTGDHLFYDHRLTFSAGEFDGVLHNKDYYSDQIHLSQLGIEVLTADFLTRFPNP